MDKQELALNLIRTPLASKLTDRAFVFPAIGVVAIWVAAILGKVSYDKACELTAALTGGPAIAEKVKDGLIGMFAVKPDAPSMVAGGTVNMPDNSAPTPAFNESEPLPEVTI